MLAHHPETGQPIRILRSNAQITQSRRTLVWLQEGYEVSTRWQRWHIVLSDPALWEANRSAVTALVVPSYSAQWLPVLREASGSCLIVLRDKAVEKALKREGLPVDQYVQFEELFSMYPFLGEPVKAGDPLEKAIVSVAHILRFSHLVWSAEPSSEWEVQQKSWQTACAGVVQTVSSNASADVVPQCWLIQQYFKHPSPRRAREITMCLEKNIANPYIDRILLLNEEEYELPASEKVVQKCIGHRLTYLDVLQAIRTDVSAGAFVIFANSDIWCDGSLQALWMIPLAERRLFLALLRWEEEEIFGPRSDSQDTWILAKETVDFEPTEEEFGFPFGKPGCDNAIAVAMLKKRCLVVNPAYSIKTHHVHASKVRDYNPRDVLYKPAYLYVDPTAIQMFAVEEHMKAWETKTVGGLWRTQQPQQSFPRRLHSVNEAHAKTIVRAIADREGEAIQVDGANLWTPSPQAWPLYEMRNTFASSTGLLSNLSSIFVGGHDAWKRGWEGSQLSTLASTLHIPAMISWMPAVDCWKSLSTWCLYYLPMILRVRKVAGPEYEFLVPTLPDVPPFLYDCIWRDAHIGTIPHIPNVQYYCNRLLAPAPLESRISREDVRLLRELLPPCGKRGAVVVCLEEGEGAIFTQGWFEEWRTCHAILLKGARLLTVAPGASARVRREAFQQADWVFGRREALQWSWMTRPGTRIVEWMLETEISSEILHLAGAADCTYIVSLVRKEPVEYQREHAILEFAKLWVEYAFPETVAATVKDKPTVILPAGKALTGIWNHTGDSFREMVRVWADRGYCEVKESEETPYIWWGDIGQVVLFDWDVPRWWNPELTYQLALFGNCAPPGPAGHESRQSVWSFWPRHPRALEDAAAGGRLGWSERTIRSLFLGKVENGVQRARRCGVDWSKAVDLFSMPLDSTGAPYPYSQSEYLATLQKARFGLALPGFGTKCNREIEYFALGVVPIAVPEVDFTHYLVPPREGEHYFRAKTPEDVQRIVAETTEEVWERMSAACQTWWRQNASAEGLFRLTWGRIEQCRPTQGLFVPPWR